MSGSTYNPRSHPPHMAMSFARPDWRVTRAAVWLRQRTEGGDCLFPRGPVRIDPTWEGVVV